MLRTLAYVTGRPTDELREIRPPEREDELLDVLNRQPYLVVLDGLERLLLAYARPDAARLADDDLDELTANVAAGALGLPASAAASYTGQTRLRLTADPRAGAFLKRLAGVRAARVLVTSRLYPAELQTVTMEPIPGTFAYFLRGLAPNDTVQLWRSLGGSGNRAELAELFAVFDNYPLLIRALAGEVARFRRAPGNLAAWRQANPGFDPFRLPLVQRKSHVLSYALSGLTAGDRRILHTIAAFRARRTTTPWQRCWSALISRAPPRLSLTGRWPDWKIAACWAGTDAGTATTCTRWCAGWCGPDSNPTTATESICGSPRISNRSRPSMRTR